MHKAGLTRTRNIGRLSLLQLGLGWPVSKKFKAPHPSVFEKADELKIIVYNKSDFDWAREQAAKVMDST